MRTLPPGHDVLLYDGACRLCRRAAARLAVALPPETATSSFREAGILRRFPRLDVSACESAIQLVRKDGMVFAGAEAVVQALRGAWYGRLLKAYYLPVVRRATDAAYGAIARRRFLTRASPGTAAAPPAPAPGPGRAGRGAPPRRAPSAPGTAP